MAKERIVNLVELGRRPDRVRYVWVSQLNDGSINLGATWMTLRRVLDEAEVVKNKQIKIMDLKKNTVHILLRSELEEFMELWRANYRDYKWDIE